MAEALVHAEEIGKTYGTVVKTVALHDVSFEIEAGEFASVIGQSGSGKSTLLNLIGLLDTPTTGRIVLNGHDATAANRKQRAALRTEPALNGLKVTEWQAQNSDLLSALKSQSSSSYMIQFFVLVAVALGIASTLAISAVQKTRQIGILKAMGMKDRQSGRIFLWQALILGVSGAAVGVAAGLGLIALFTFLGRNSTSLFPITPQVGFVVISFVVGVLVAVGSSLIPSRRTKKLDPIEVIQGG